MTPTAAAKKPPMQQAAPEEPPSQSAYPPVCEPWCEEPCAFLNGDVRYECNSCVGAQFRCRPGEPGYPGAAAAATVTVSATGDAVPGRPSNIDVVARPAGPQTIAAMAAWADANAAALASGGASMDEASGGFSVGGASPTVEFEELVEASCAPYLRTIGEGANAVAVCPVLNGIWTSFLDIRKWRSYETSLSEEQSARVLEGMRRYDEVGLSTWIGEDFDERVLSALEAHRRQGLVARGDARGDARGVPRGDEGVDPSVGTPSSAESPAATALAYSIIVERGHDVMRGLEELRARLGDAALRWVQLGPPALEQLPAYRDARASGLVTHYGVEDYGVGDLERMSAVFPVATVQQETNLLVRPSAETRAFCSRHGCRFVAYGPLLGGLLSDRFLGAARPPTPDADHSKQIDYLNSIQAWGDWGRFQALLRTLRSVADAHGAEDERCPIAVVALAYVLQLPYVLAAIVGVRLGGVMGADHRRDSLRALALQLAPEERAAIDAAVAEGVVLDGLART